MTTKDTQHILTPTNKALPNRAFVYPLLLMYIICIREFFFQKNYKAVGDRYIEWLPLPAGNHSPPITITSY